MGTTPLRKFLQSLCCNTCWNYAVFWKLQQQRQMLLTWEDGYCDDGPHQFDSMESILADTGFGGSKETSSCDTYDGAFGEYVVGLAVAYMSNVQYALGDGVVGEVACSGNYRWVFSESTSCGEFDTTLIPEWQHPDEWLFQFAAGIKTILLVPVVPHGVLQLGSLETLPEDASMAAYIKDEFVAHLNFMAYSEAFTTNRQLQAQPPSSLMSKVMENIDDLPFSRVNEMKYDNSTVLNDVKWINQQSPFDTPYPSHLEGTEILRSSINLTEAGESTQLDLSKLGGRESNMSRYLEEEVPAISYCNSSSVGIFEEHANRPLQSQLVKQPVVNDVDLFLAFPKECELHKALGPTFMGKVRDCLQEISVSDNVYNSSSQICNEDLVCGSHSSASEVNGVIVNKDDAENLFGHVVKNACLGENSSIQTSDGGSPTNSFGQFTCLTEGRNENGKSAIVGKGSLVRNHVAAAVPNSGRILNASTSPSAASYESVITELVEEGERKRIPHQTNNSKPSSVGKRRGKPADKQKPRPRDRQLIQDRLKELRELVPNGEKCSIDGLLDRTVTHMVFLKSVSDRANKLRQWVQPEGDGMKTKKAPELRGSTHNGASWAFELGGDQEICPILVEDLEYPGHMIIEMICDESGRFLEIAEVIHGLELTILKGVTERRSGHTWAHFVIEAPRGLQRLDIFWPLMKLLQQQRSPISSKI